jgi:hypothetical protein
MTMTEGTPDVVAAPARRMTLLGELAASLGNAMLGAVVVLIVVAAVALAVQAISSAGSFVLEALGWS